MTNTVIEETQFTGGMPVERRTPHLRFTMKSHGPHSGSPLSSCNTRYPGIQGSSKFSSWQWQQGSDARLVLLEVVSRLRATGNGASHYGSVSL